MRQRNKISLANKRRHAKKKEKEDKKEIVDFTKLDIREELAKHVGLS